MSQDRKQEAATTARMTAVQALNLALDDAMVANADVFVLGEDVADREEGGICGVTKGCSCMGEWA
jgi:pyruvate/2-oxoglutarate/acetoin dehydrogenase E1 component